MDAGQLLAYSCCSYSIALEQNVVGGWAWVFHVPVKVPGFSLTVGQTTASGELGRVTTRCASEIPLR